jgi:hypothetical protein
MTERAGVKARDRAAGGCAAVHIGSGPALSTTRFSAAYLFPVHSTASTLSRILADGISNNLRPKRSGG